MIGPCFDMHYLVSFQFCNNLAKEERAGCFIDCLLAVECIWCSVYLPHGVDGWAAVCDCGISWSYVFTF